MTGSDLGQNNSGTIDMDDFVDQFVSTCKSVELSVDNDNWDTFKEGLKRRAHDSLEMMAEDFDPSGHYYQQNVENWAWKAFQNHLVEQETVKISIDAGLEEKVWAVRRVATVKPKGSKRAPTMEQIAHSKELPAHCQQLNASEIRMLMAIHKLMARRLFMEHLGLVKAIVYRRFSWHSDKELIVQEGLIALLKAAHKYDPGRKTAFISFAGTCVKFAIFKELRFHQFSGLTGVPLDRVWKVKRARNELIKCISREPTAREIASLLGEAEGKVEEALELLRSSFPSIEELREKSGHELGDGSDSLECGPTPEDLTITKELLELIKAAIEQLPENYREVVRPRLIHRLEYEEIANNLGISYDSARQCFSRGMKKLREILILLAIEQISEANRDVIRMALINRLEFEEIAAKLCIGEEEVRKRFRQGMKELWEVFGDVIFSITRPAVRNSKHDGSREAFW